MAALSHSSASTSMSINSYDTALCVIPPSDLCKSIDQLRELYDKAHGKWPAHINLLYPFVVPEHLERARNLIQTALTEEWVADQAHTITLENPGLFAQRNSSTVFLQENGIASESTLAQLQNIAFQALGRKPTASHMHLTVGQTEDNTLSSREYLMSKARLLPTLSFQLSRIAILIRERSTAPKAQGAMRLWGTVELTTPLINASPLTETWITPSTEELLSNDSEATITDHEVQIGRTLAYHPQSDKWIVLETSAASSQVDGGLSVASYNVLIDSEYPPARERDPLVVKTILAESSKADIIVLQEVSDDFLSFMLEDSEVRQLYPFTSHGPPNQSDLGPLPSLRNIVILSRYSFTWKFLPFSRRHKGAVLATFKGILAACSPEQDNLTVAGVHLTCGLTDGSVAAKKVQLDNLLNHLNKYHTSDSWIVAGDFNIPTSTYTIDTALRNKSIVLHTKETLTEMESTIINKGLVDLWAATHGEETGDHADMDSHLFGGEHGGTFNPMDNSLAAATSGTSENRPQRYDRILVRSDSLQPTHFNLFGLPEIINGVMVVPSDHYGIRGLFHFASTEIDDQNGIALHDRATPTRVAPTSLQPSDMIAALAEHGMFPTTEEREQRQDAIELLRRVVIGSSSNDDVQSMDIPMVMVTVGSYALGTWTVDSDVDCLCIGTISSKTFFKLVRQRLIKAESQGVKLIRKVEANTGTMLELSVNGIAMDLQYCPAARFVEGWPESTSLPAPDPMFNLPMLSLRKLKPYRDLQTILHSTGCSLTSYQHAYLCIKLWAMQRGLYSAKLGYLGGTHISLMLSAIFRSQGYGFDQAPCDSHELLRSFFHHYAHFQWASTMVYDPCFHQQKPRYHRTTREPMVVLGYHAPNSNIAHTATIPGMRILVDHFKAADEQLADPNMTYDNFFGLLESDETVEMQRSVKDFVSKYEHYVKIDIQFWGRTLARGKGLVGWVESRCLWLIVEINRVLPNLEVRLWPARFTDSESNEGNDYQGCYLVGLSTNASHTSYAEDKKELQVSRDKVLTRFLDQLKAEEKFYDPSTSWIGISLAKRADIASHRLDTREWGTYVMEIEPDSDDEEEIPSDSEDVDKIKAPIRTIPQRPKSTSTPVSPSKLRPASDVLNRLRWDPNLDPAEYLIGYEDRFLGAKETSLEKWKTEQTDEEFIPQHRILYFKKKETDGNGEIVWERVTRIDKVFGSGIGSGLIA